MKSIIASVFLAALVGLANAKVILTNTDYDDIEVGKPFEITWADATGPVTITLKTGAENDLKTVTDLAAGQTDTSFTWTPSTALSGNYALQISDGTDINYSPMFSLDGTATTTTASSSASSSTTAVSSTLTTITTSSSSSASSAASSTPASSSSVSPSSSAAPISSSAAASSSSPATSSSSSATSTRASSTSASATPSTTVAPNNNDAQGVVAPLFAPLLVALGAALL
ncbi:Ser-Thr-rich glycosyl-phosphatidyl-inositol-anchored membrane family-domain-containing protein [Biscogniauxia marginata]|nr:Ser-Thr-rich glycosyl-phosphatidyl-inositol-anchored membrane family-domain-containing protein [Biscogniauxia marginata]